MKTFFIKYSQIFILSFFIIGCSTKSAKKDPPPQTNTIENFARKDGCHLDQMNINGDVIKVETIVQSSMPLTELFAKSFNPYTTVSLYAGNITIDFDNVGNIKHSTGYGMNGETLFEVNNFKSNEQMNFTPAVLIGLNATQHIDKIETVSSNDGNVEVEYYDGNNLIWKQWASYNENGSIKSIIKDYECLKIKTDLFTISYSDTTNFKYLSFDEQLNWTEVEVEYKGILPKHAHKYKIKRQITYNGDAVKPSLIKELTSYNHITSHTTDTFDLIKLDKYGSIKIPHYMILKDKKYINNVINNSPLHSPSYLFMSVYDNNDAYATFSVGLSPGDGSNFNNLTAKQLAFDEELDKDLEVQQNSSNCQILKWLPYSFIGISNKMALKIRYYRYSNGGPIPVYCEIYTIPMPDGNILSIIYSFQSNLDYRFHSDFDNAIKSIVLSQ